MSSYQKFYDFTWALLEQLPSLITILACLIFTVIRRKRYPQVAMLVLLGLVLLLLHGPIFAAVYNWVPDLLIDRSRNNSDGITSSVMITLGLLYHAALAIPFALLLAAIFTRRQPTETSA
jgi:hypothetical protein